MNRVYVHDGEVWTLASVYALKASLTSEREYVVHETERPPSVEEVCGWTDDGRYLCDIGPDHEHVQ